MTFDCGFSTPNTQYSGAECVIFAPTPQYASAQQKACMSNGGMVVTSCPTAALVGCCLTQTPPAGTQELCYYTGTAKANQKLCTTSLGGTWSTSF